MSMLIKSVDYKQIAKDQKENVHSVRLDFFNSLLSEWSRAPAEIDLLMNQEDSYFKPDFASHLKDDPGTILIKDVDKGILACSVTPNQEDSPLRWVYSILQAGDWLRYGLLIQGPPKLILQYERHHDNILGIEKIWDRNCEYQFRDAGGLLLEWRFEEPDFYTNYACRERFVIIARHLHLRIGKILHLLIEGDDFNLDSQSSWDDSQPED